MTNTLERTTEIEIWIAEKLAAQLNTSPEQMDVNAPFTSFGIDSIAIFTLTGDLAEWLDRDLPFTLLWEYPTIHALAHQLSQEA
jgi:acyl carrier protein